MSKKRDRHLQANEVYENRYQLEQERKAEEFKTARGKISPIRTRHSPDLIIKPRDESCLWHLGKYLLIPIVLVIFVAILKACSL